jgi:hypothetical protein
VKLQITLAEFPAVVALAGFHQQVDQSFQFVQVGVGDEGTRPLQRQCLQFDTQCVELAHFVGGKRSDETAFVFNAANESLVFERNESLAYHRRADIHFPSNLAFDDGISRFQFAGEKGILQRGDYPLRQ